MKLDIQFKGLRELYDSLVALPPPFRDEAIREGLRRGGDALKRGMEHRAPVAPVHRVMREGRAYLLPLRAGMRTRLHMRDPNPWAEVGPAKVTFWGRFQELGTKGQPGKHFMQQTLEQDAQIAIAACATGVRDKFTAIIRRVAKRPR